MTNLETAKSRIREAQLINDNTLDLNDLSITTDNLTTLIPLMTEIENLRVLLVNNNLLTTLPEEIWSLQDLEVLSIENNQLTALSEKIGTLLNLEGLSVSNNLLTTVPDGIWDLPFLKILLLNNNQLTTLSEGIGSSLMLEGLSLVGNQLITLPREIINLSNLTALELTGNPLSDETRDMLNTQGTVFSQSIETSGYLNVLKKIYGEQEAIIISKKINDLNSGSFLTAIESSKTGKQVITEFLEKVPINNLGTDKIYIPTAKYIIDQIVNEKVEKNRNTCLQKIATSLGNCATPIKSFLVQNAIGQHIDAYGNITPDFLSWIKREAVEAKIFTKLKDYLHKNEKIEQVQALDNALFLEAAEKNPDNKVQIIGDRDRLPSKTAHVDFAFRQVRDDLAKAFTKMICKTDKNGCPIKNKDDKYFLDNQKINAITESYLTSLGIVSEREKCLYKYDKNIQEFLRNDYSNLALEHFDKKDVVPILDILAQKKDLSNLLMTTPDHNIQNVFTKFLSDQKKKVLYLAKKYGDHRQASIVEKDSPLNNLRRSSKSSQTSKKTSTMRSQG